jgi:hypothetical protein
MPAKDVYHEAVKNALIKDGWLITFDPYPITAVSALMRYNLIVGANGIRPRA